MHQLQPVAEQMDRLGRQHAQQRLIQQALWRAADEGFGIGRDAGDAPVPGERQQKTEGLDRAEDVNRFPVAVAQVDLAGGVMHAVWAPVVAVRLFRTG